MALRRERRFCGEFVRVFLCELRVELLLRCLDSFDCSLLFSTAEDGRLSDIAVTDVGCSCRLDSVVPSARASVIDSHSLADDAMDEVEEESETSTSIAVTIFVIF